MQHKDLIERARGLDTREQKIDTNTAHLDKRQEKMDADTELFNQARCVVEEKIRNAVESAKKQAENFNLRLAASRNEAAKLVRMRVHDESVRRDDNQRREKERCGLQEEVDALKKSYVALQAHNTDIKDCDRLNKAQFTIMTRQITDANKSRNACEIKYRDIQKDLALVIASNDSTHAKANTSHEEIKAQLQRLFHDADADNTSLRTIIEGLESQLIDKDKTHQKACKKVSDLTSNIAAQREQLDLAKAVTISGRAAYHRLERKSDETTTEYASNKRLFEESQANHETREANHAMERITFHDAVKESEANQILFDEWRAYHETQEAKHAMEREKNVDIAKENEENKRLLAKSQADHETYKANHVTEQLRIAKIVKESETSKRLLETLRGNHATREANHSATEKTNTDLKDRVRELENEQMNIQNNHTQSALRDTFMNEVLNTLSA